jgi:hypothetical protein
MAAYLLLLLSFVHLNYYLKRQFYIQRSLLGVGCTALGLLLLLLLLSLLLLQVLSLILIWSQFYLYYRLLSKIRLNSQCLLKSWASVCWRDCRARRGLRGQAAAILPKAGERTRHRVRGWSSRRMLSRHSSWIHWIGRYV